MMDQKMDQKAIKEMTGRAAVEALVKNGMKLGLGTGSTAIPAVQYIGALLAEGKLRDILAHRKLERDIRSVCV